MSALLTVVVGTYNQPILLSWCMRTLTNYAPWDYRLMVVDGSEDSNLQEDVEQRLTDLPWDDKAILHTGRNMKAMGAFNVALAVCETPYIAFLHDDAAFIPNSSHFWPTLTEIVSNPEVGMAGPCLSDCVGLQHYSRWDLPMRLQVWYLYGACTVFDTELIRSLGGMDENISPSDDVELSIRMNQNGYAIVVDRSCFLYHHRHQTYKDTRPGNDTLKLENSFNKIVRKHGVAATTEPWFHETEWEIAKIVSPTVGEFEKRIEGGAPEWLA